jgi:hypothetical protein
MLRISIQVSSHSLNPFVEPCNLSFLFFKLPTHTTNDFYVLSLEIISNIFIRLTRLTCTHVSLKNPKEKIPIVQKDEKI